MGSVPDLTLLKRIKELRDRGLGYRAIVKELKLGVSYRTVARWLKKYGHFLNGVKVTGNLTADHGKSLNLSDVEPVNTVRVGVNKKHGVTAEPNFSRLGKTERMVLKVILANPGFVWSANMVWSKLGLMRYRVSRRAVWMAMERLKNRGILYKYPKYVKDLRDGRVKEFRLKIFEGEVIKGAYRLVAYEPSSFAVHNLRIPNHQVIADDVSVNLTQALFVGSVTYGEAPITQMELNSDIPIPQNILGYLRNIGWGFTVIYPKPKLGVLRIEHRIWPNDLLLTLKHKDEIERRGKLITEIVNSISNYEVSRLSNNKKKSSDRRGVLFGVI